LALTNWETDRANETDEADQKQKKEIRLIRFIRLIRSNRPLVLVRCEPAYTDTDGLTDANGETTAKLNARDTLERHLKVPFLSVRPLASVSQFLDRNGQRTP
jgi:hypothetical protein